MKKNEGIRLIYMSEGWTKASETILKVKIVSVNCITQSIY